MKIFVKILTFVLIPIILAFVAMYMIFQSQFTGNAEAEFEKELKNKWSIVKNFVTPIEDIEKLGRSIRTISKETPLRISIIDKDGVVIDDSYLKTSDVLRMDLHNNRPEIVSALSEGEGTNKRFSKTMKQEMIYYAKKLNKDYILRVAYPMHYINTIHKSIRTHSLFSFALIASFLIILLSYISFRISLPALKLNRIVNEIEEGTIPEFPPFRDKFMEKVAGLIERTFMAVKTQKEVIQHEKKKIEKMVSILDEGIINIDNKNNVILANNKASELLGCELKTGRNIYKQIEDPECTAFIKKVLSGKKNKPQTHEMKEFTFETYVRKADNTKILVIIDITDRAQYEYYKTELISNISHELKTPLAMIMGYAETLINHEDIDPKNLQMFLKKIYSGASQLNVILNDVLELLKLESALPEGDIRADDLNILDFMAEFKEYYGDNKEKNITFNMEDVTIKIYQGHLMSILTNLVDNAIKYSEDDKIDVAITMDGKKLIVTVSDGGPAIPAQERTRIFERFYTVSKSRNRNHSSTGLGLSIVKHICRLYSGSIEVFENKRGGNTFKAVLQVKRTKELARSV